MSNDKKLEAEPSPCAACGHVAHPVHRAADDEGNPLPEPEFKGWFCAHCGYVTKPIFRERKLGIPL